MSCGGWITGKSFLAAKAGKSGQSGGVEDI